jgi:Ca2+-binding EF-hand superfamily protein
LIALRLLFSIFDRWGRGFIEYDDLLAYGEETGDFSRIRDVNLALEILDVDGDGRIGLLDFIHFAARLRNRTESSCVNNS